MHQDRWRSDADFVIFSGISDPQIVGTLQRKRDAIERVIAEYEKKIETAKCDLSHVNATLAMFEAPEGRTQFPIYMDTLRLFRRGEIVTICKAALAEEGSLDTRELASRVVKAKGVNAEDAVLRRSVAFRIVQARRLQMKRRTITALPSARE